MSEKEPPHPENNPAAISGETDPEKTISSTSSRGIDRINDTAPQDSEQVEQQMQNEPHSLGGRVVHRSELHLGPLPSPKQLEAYGDIDSTFPERIMQLAEGEAEHRREMERRAIGAQIDDAGADRRERRLGQVFAFLITISAFGIGTWLALSGHDTVAGIVFGTMIVGLAAVFAVGRRAVNKAEQDQHDD